MTGGHRAGLGEVGGGGGRLGVRSLGGLCCWRVCRGRVSKVRYAGHLRYTGVDLKQLLFRLILGHGLLI